MLVLSDLARFNRCGPVVVRFEGDYVNNPKDPGGATDMGMTLRALEAQLGHACTWAQVKALTPAEVRDICAEMYRAAVCGGDLLAGVDLTGSTRARTAGGVRAATLLQIRLGVTPDGSITPVTLKALAAVNDWVAVVGRTRRIRLLAAGLSEQPRQS